MLKLKKVRKSISGIVITDDVTAAFPEGEITALIGPNGAGKTTLFHLICGAITPDMGKITYRGQDLAGLQPYQSARQGVGRLFQDVRIFENLTVFENVVAACYPPEAEMPWFPFIWPGKTKKVKSEAKARAEGILERFCLVDKMRQPAGELSFGQQKILAIARLMAADSSLLLFDEPTAGLSPVVIAEIMRVIRRIVEEDRSRTVVIVEHNMSVVSEIAQWVFFMNEGRIAFTGRTDHVLGCREVREMYLGLGDYGA